MLFIHIGSLWLLLCSLYAHGLYMCMFVACCVVTYVCGVHVYAHVACCLAHFLSCACVYAYAYYV